ncbi:hypothetical protein BGX21_000885, partial [Mortierella sp. AD011]
ENREQLVAAGVLDSLSYNNSKVAIAPRPLQRSQSHTLSNSSPPSPSPNGQSPSNGFAPSQDRYGTSPHGSRSVGPASSKYFGTSSPSSFQRPSTIGHPSFGHSSSYQNEGGNHPRYSHHHSYSSDHTNSSNGYHHYPQGGSGHQQHYSDQGHHEMSSSLPSHFHMHQSQPRPLRWEPRHGSNGHSNGARAGSLSPKAEPMDVTMSSSLPSLPSHGSNNQSTTSMSFSHHGGNGSHTPGPHSPSHHRHHHSQDYSRSPLSSSSPSHHGNGYEQQIGHNGYSEGYGGRPPHHQHSHSGSFHSSSSTSRGSPGPYSQSYPSQSPMQQHQHSSPSLSTSSQQQSPQSGHHHYSSSPSSSSYYQSHSSPIQGYPPHYGNGISSNGNGYGHHASLSMDDRRFHSAPIPVRHR